MQIELNDFQASYFAPGVVILFRAEPGLQAIKEARNLLDQVTDTLILKGMENDGL
jgi:hypothetical protein